MTKRSARLAAFWVVIVATLFIAVHRIPWAYVAPVAAQGTAVMPAAPSSAPGGLLAGIDAALEGIYARVSPSVVAIHVIQDGAAGRREGLGSGFVWDANGHIVTNNHVVAAASGITVVLSDGTSLPGKVVAADPDSDLAVVQVDTSRHRLMPVQMGDSRQVRVGQQAVTIGNPFGEQNTMTTGIVSALERSLPVDDGGSMRPTYTIPDVIQTDAPINPGNSGGVLLDAEGRVIGVTSAIASPVGTSAGIGFAIPSAIARRVVPALISTGHYRHPWLGVGGRSVTPEIAKAIGLAPEQRGVLVLSVTVGSPADRAGIRGGDRDVDREGVSTRVGGDVIVALDGRPMRTFDDLAAGLARDTNVGQRVSITIIRQGREQGVTATLSERPVQSGQ